MDRTMKSELDERLRFTHVGFLMTGLETGISLAKAGLDSNEGERTRNRENARKAYDAILCFESEMTLMQSDKERLDEGLVYLKSLLQRLGESF